MNIKYIFPHPDDPTKFKIESRSTAPINALAVTDLDYSEARYILAVVDGLPVMDDALRATDDAVNAATDAIGALYKTLNDEVLADMAITFDTTKTDSAITNYIMYMDMQNFPDEYVDKGIKVQATLNAADGSPLFGPGDMLNTSEKVLSFANRKIIVAREYGIMRLQKIDAFIDSKNAILGV